MTKEINRDSLIYIDHNVYSNYLDNKPNTKVLLDDYKKEYNFCYSPAHIEEIANIDGENAQKFKSNILDFLKSITNCNAILSKDEKVFNIIKEDPYICYQRVVDWPYNDEIEEMMVFNNNPDISANYLKVYGTEKSVISNDKDIFNNPLVVKIIKSTMMNYLDRESNSIIFNKSTKDAIGVNFHSTQYVIMWLFKILKNVGFNNERERDTYYRGRTHDVTHAIYATQCCKFITSDKKFSIKLKEVYKLLGINTEVILIPSN